LFDQALATLDEGRSRSLLRKADSRIWAAAGSIPLYQRPQLTAVRKDVVNVGAFGFQTPVYEDMGFLKSAKGSVEETAKGTAEGTATKSALDSVEETVKGTAEETATKSAKTPSGQPGSPSPSASRE
jgi:hypothetical protein